MKRLFILVLLFLCSNCAVLDSVPYVGTDELTGNIGVNAARMNDAHARATKAVILQNILWARDRWGSGFTTLSGIRSEPQLTFSVNGELSPIGLGNPKAPLGESKIGATQQDTAAASYTINPFKNPDNAFDPINPELFGRYWNNGWPKDVLLLVLANAITVDGERFENSLKPEAQKKFWLQIAKLLPQEKCNLLMHRNVKKLPLSEEQYSKPRSFEDCKNGNTLESESKLIAVSCEFS